MCALRDCAIAYTQGTQPACVKTSTLRNGSPLSPMRFLTLCLEREGGARTNMTGENVRRAPNARGFPRRSACTEHIQSVFFPSPTAIENQVERSMNFESGLPLVPKIVSSCCRYPLSLFINFLLINKRLMFTQPPSHKLLQSHQFLSIYDFVSKESL